MHLRHDLKCEGFYRFEDAEAATSYSDPASMLRIESSAGAGIEIKGNGGPGRAHGKDPAFWELCSPESPCTYGTQNCCSQAILHPQWGWVPCMVMSWGHHEAFQCHWVPPIQPRSSAQPHSPPHPTNRENRPGRKDPKTYRGSKISCLAMCTIPNLSNVWGFLFYNIHH